MVRALRARVGVPGVDPGGVAGARRHMIVEAERAEVRRRHDD